MTDDDNGWVLADEWTLRLEVSVIIPLSLLDDVRKRIELVLSVLVGSGLAAPGRLRLDVL